MGAALFVQPNFTTQDAATYKAALDAAIAVLARRGRAWAPHQQDSGSPAPDMSVRVDPGAVFYAGTMTEVAAQTVSGFTAPSSGQHRVDRVVVDPFTGVASRVAGTAVSGSPSATPPAIPPGKVPVCQVLITSSDTVITNSMITDERLDIIPPRTFLGKKTGSGSSLSFTSTDFDWTIFDWLEFSLWAVPGTNGTALDIVVSENGGSSYLGGANYSRSMRGRDSAANDRSASGEGESIWRLNEIATAGISNSAANGGIRGTLKLWTPASAIRHMATFNGSYFPGGVANVTDVTGSLMVIGTPAALSGIRFQPSSGSWTSIVVVAEGFRSL